MAYLYEDIDRRFQVDQVQPSSRVAGEWFPKLMSQLLPTIFRHSLAVKRQEGIDQRASMWDAWKLTTQSMIKSGDSGKLEDWGLKIDQEMARYEEGSVEYNNLLGIREATNIQIGVLEDKYEEEAYKADLAGHAELWTYNSKKKLVDDDIFRDMMDEMEWDLYGMPEKEYDAWIEKRTFGKEEYVDAQEDMWLKDFNSRPGSYYQISQKDMPDFGAEWDRDNPIPDDKELGMIGTYESDPEKYHYLIPYIERMEGLLNLSANHLYASGEFKAVDKLLIEMDETIMKNANNKEFWTEGDWKELATDMQKNKHENQIYWEAADEKALSDYFTRGASLDAGYSGLNYLDSIDPDLQSDAGKEYSRLARQTINANLSRINSPEIRRGLGYLDNIIIEEKIHRKEQTAALKADIKQQKSVALEKATKYKAEYSTWQKSQAATLSGDLSTLQDAVQGKDATRRHDVYQTGEFALMSKPASGWDKGTVAGKISPANLTALKTRLAGEARKLIVGANWAGASGAPADIQAAAAKMHETGQIEDMNAFVDKLLEYDDSGYDFDYVGVGDKERGALKIMRAIGETLKTIKNIESAGKVQHPVAGWEAKIGVTSKAEDDRDKVQKLIEEVQTKGKVIQDTSSVDTSDVDSSLGVDLGNMNQEEVEAAILDTNALAALNTREMFVNDSTARDEEYALFMEQLKRLPDSRSAIQQEFDKNPDFWFWAMNRYPQQGGGVVNPDIYSGPNI